MQGLTYLEDGKEQYARFYAHWDRRTIHPFSDDVMVVDREKEKHQDGDDVELPLYLHFATWNKDRSENSRECQVSKNF